MLSTSASGLRAPAGRIISSAFSMLKARLASARVRRRRSPPVCSGAAIAPRPAPPCTTPRAARCRHRRLTPLRGLAPSAAASGACRLSLRLRRAQIGKQARSDQVRSGRTGSGARAAAPRRAGRGPGPGRGVGTGGRGGGVEGGGRREGGGRCGEGARVAVGVPELCCFFPGVPFLPPVGASPVSPVCLA